MFAENIEIGIDELITGEKFVGLGQYVHNHYGDIRGGNLRTAAIVYSDSAAAQTLLPLIPRDHPARIITHNGDTNITDALASQMPDNVTHWFTQNVMTAHPKVHSLPIGLENRRWFPQIGKHAKIVETRRTPVEPMRLLYMNHTVSTNRAEREPPYRLLAGKSWVTAVQGGNGFMFDQYLAAIRDHFYILCPAGNGVDTHRVWEALYCNRVPVMRRNLNTRFYEDLPILLVDAWEEVTEGLLRRRMEGFRRGRFNLEKLRFSFWKRQIVGGSGI